MSKASGDTSDLAPSQNGSGGGEGGGADGGGGGYSPDGNEMDQEHLGSGSDTEDDSKSTSEPSGTVQRSNQPRKLRDLSGNRRRTVTGYSFGNGMGVGVGGQRGSLGNRRGRSAGMMVMERPVVDVFIPHRPDIAPCDASLEELLTTRRFAYSYEEEGKEDSRNSTEDYMEAVRRWNDNTCVRLVSMVLVADSEEDGDGDEKDPEEVEVKDEFTDAVPEPEAVGGGEPLQDGDLMDVDEIKQDDMDMDVVEGSCDAKVEPEPEGNEMDEDGDANASINNSDDTSKKASPPGTPSPPPKHEASVYYPPLGEPTVTDDMIDAIVATFHFPPNHLISIVGERKLYRKDLEIIKGREWLEDQVVDFYLEMIKLRCDEHPEVYPKIYVYESTFFTLLDTKEGLDKVEKAADDVNISNYELLLIPVCQRHHWRLIVVNIPERKITSYNSVAPPFFADVKNMNNVERYLKKVMSRANLPQIVWEKERPSEIPFQDNTDDCGVFVLQYANYLCKRQPFNFSADSMPYFRIRVMYECIVTQLL